MRPMPPKTAWSRLRTSAGIPTSPCWVAETRILYQRGPFLRFIERANPKHPSASMNPAAHARSRSPRSGPQSTAPITIKHFPNGRGGLSSLYWTQIAPEQCDRRLGLFEPPRLPHVDSVFVRTDDLSHSEHRGLKAVQDLWGFAMTALRHGCL